MSDSSAFNLAEYEAKLAEYKNTLPVKVKPENTLELCQRTGGDDVSPDPGHRTQENSAREVHTTIENRCGHDLVRLDYGKSPLSEWVTEPPQTISSWDTNAYFRVDSNGFMEGAHGWVLYGFKDNTYQQYYFQVDDPYYGSNFMGADSPSGYGCNILGGGGNDAYPTFQLWKQN